MSNAETSNAEVWDDDLDDEHSCVAGGPAWQEGFNAGRATGRNEALDELRKAPAEARGVVDLKVVEAEVLAVVPGGDSCDPQQIADDIREVFTALTEARNG